MYLAAKVECGEIVRASLFDKREDAVKCVKYYLMTDKILLAENHFEEFLRFNNHVVWEILGDDNNPHIVYQVHVVYKD